MGPLLPICLTSCFVMPFINVVVDGQQSKSNFTCSHDIAEVLRSTFIQMPHGTVRNVQQLLDEDVVKFVEVVPQGQEVLNAFELLFPDEFCREMR